MDGILIIDKPIGKSSFDIIRDIRKEYNTKKIGHIGTLDPLATGVLPILIGKATKLSNYLMEHDKEYIATLHLGIQTDTGDSEGKVINTQDINGIFELSNQNFSNNESTSSLNNYDRIISVLNSFLGETSQIPPMYSAIKVSGKKLYELAREGKTVERTPRKITIYSIDLINVDSVQSELTFKVNCSKGTYIRTLCEDIAKQLGTCGYMKALKRTRVGSFKLEDAGKLIELKDILTGIPRVNVENIEKLKNGMSIPMENCVSEQYSGFVNLFYRNEFIGIGKAENKYYRRFILL